MRCPRCKCNMEIRNGKFGAFYFCPNQYKGCKQKTISVQSLNKASNYNEDYSDDCYDIRERKRVIDSLGCADYDIYGERILKDDNGYGDPCEDSGFWENEGEWFRPY